MKALYLTRDLIFASRVAGAARAEGCTLETLASCQALIERTRHTNPDLVLIDLDAAGSDELEPSVRQLQAHQPRPAIVAYGSHVLAGRLDRARQAGCDQVLTRGQFDRQCQQLLRPRPPDDAQ